MKKESPKKNKSGRLSKSSPKQSSSSRSSKRPHSSLKRGASQKELRSSRTPSRPARKSVISEAVRKSRGAKLSKEKKLQVLQEITQPTLPVTIHPAAEAADLPASYNRTQLTLLVRDPYWAYGYWDFSSDTWNWVQDMFKKRPGTRAVLRVHNVDKRHFDDLDVHLDAKNWYLHLGIPNTTFEAELGLVEPSGQFHQIVKSNRIKTPRDGPSDMIDENWKPTDFDLIYKLSGGGQTGLGSELFSQFKKRPSF